MRLFALSAFLFACTGTVIMFPVAATGGACDNEEPADKVLAALQNAPGLQAPDLIPTTKMFPAGTAVDVILRDSFKPEVEYRALVEGPPVTLMRSGSEVWAKKTPPDYPPAKNVAGETTLLSLTVPSAFGSWTWSPKTVRVFGCKKAQPDAVFASSITMPVSDWIASSVVAWVPLLILYCFAAYAASTVDKQSLKGIRYFDPVVLTAGSNGKGSLSKLQILFFSIIVVGLLGYMVARVGILSSLSVTILGLLGIAGASAAASKATDVNRNRLSFSNWAWFVHSGWLPKGGLAEINDARWKDLLAADDEFDVYHFQSLILTVVVGGALLTAGFAELATFSIPETLLGILGLSQVVYVAGKLVSPPTCADLDKATTELVKLEKDFVETAAKTPDPSPPAGTDPLAPPPDLDAAKRRAGGDKFSAYESKEKEVETMFRAVMKKDPPAFVFKFRS